MSSRKRTPDRALDRVEHILDRIARIHSYVEGYSLQRLESDARTLDAVLHCLQIIGEAANFLMDGIEDRHPFIPWQDIRGMRNVLVHGYDKVDPSLVWDVVTNELAALEQAMIAERQWLATLLSRG